MVLKCKGPAVDQSFAVVPGWLPLEDDGNTLVTLERLWARAQTQLRTTENRQRLVRLAEALKDTGELCGREIVNLIG